MNREIIRVAAASQFPRALALVSESHWGNLVRSDDQDRYLAVIESGSAGIYLKRILEFLASEASHSDPARRSAAVRALSQWGRLASSVSQSVEPTGRLDSAAECERAMCHMRIAAQKIDYWPEIEEHVRTDPSCAWELAIFWAMSGDPDGVEGVLRAGLAAKARNAKWLAIAMLRFQAEPEMLRQARAALEGTEQDQRLAMHLLRMFRVDARPLADLLSARAAAAGNRLILTPEGQLPDEPVILDLEISLKSSRDRREDPPPPTTG